MRCQNHLRSLVLAPLFQRKSPKESFGLAKHNVYVYPDYLFPARVGRLSKG